MKQAKISISTTCMDGRYHKFCLWIVSNREKTTVPLIKNSYRTTMKTVTNNIYLTLMLNILNSYTSHAVICRFYLKE